MERLAGALLIPAELRRRLRQLDDCQMGRLLEDEVWSSLNLLAPESTICLVAADRLRQRMEGSPERKRFGLRRRTMRSFAAERDEGVHIMHAEVALYQGGIPCLQLPWQRNRCASNTLLVADIAQARTCLLHAGFRETPRCPAALVDSRTGKPIRLYEDKTQFKENFREWRLALVLSLPAR